MFKKSLSYNVAPWLIGVDQKNQNMRSSFEENQADRPLCYVLFCFSLFSPSFFLFGQSDFSPVLIHVATMYACNRARLENSDEENTPWASKSHLKKRL